MKDKKLKKYIVNGLTFSRVLATLAMPVLCTAISSTTFMFLIVSILLTDLLDGKLARKWDVCTLFGSLSDMGADKLLGITLLTVFSFTYPVMIIPALLEFSIASINVKSVLKGNKAKSEYIGKVKMVISGISIGLLLMLGASPEISTMTFSNNTINDAIKYISNFFINNKDIIKNTAIPATIIAETATFMDYKKEYDKVKNNESKKLLEELKRYKEYLKDYKFKTYMDEIMLNEEYHKKTLEEPLMKKLMPNKNKVVDK